MAGKRPPMGPLARGNTGKPLVPPAAAGTPPAKAARKGKPLVPRMRGAGAAAAPPAGPPPRPVRGRVAVAVPVVVRRMGPPPPGRGVPPRLTPPRAPTPPTPPGAERLEERPSTRAPVMRQRGAPAAMARLRRGQVSF